MQAYPLFVLAQKLRIHSQLVHFLDHFASDQVGKVLIFETNHVVEHLKMTRHSVIFSLDFITYQGHELGGLFQMLLWHLQPDSFYFSSILEPLDHS